MRQAWQDGIDSGDAGDVDFEALKREDRRHGGLAFTPGRLVEKVSYRQAGPPVEPSLPQMVPPIVVEVTFLAKALEVAGSIVAGVVVEMGGRQNRFGRSDAVKERGRLGASQHPPSPAAPRPRFRVPPSPIAEVDHPAAMRAPALLTPPFRPAKPDGGGDLRPVNRVEPAILSADRHRRILNPPSRIGNALRGLFLPGSVTRAPLPVTPQS